MTYQRPCQTGDVSQVLIREIEAILDSSEADISIAEYHARIGRVIEQFRDLLPSTEQTETAARKPDDRSRESLILPKPHNSEVKWQTTPALTALLLRRNRSLR